MDAVIHVWLEASVCHALGDVVCEALADHEARVALGLATADGGLPDGAVLDAAADAALEAGASDAGRDAGPRGARRRRDAGPPADAGPR
jgi:hypothetical protein